MGLPLSKHQRSRFSASHPRHPPSSRPFSLSLPSPRYVPRPSTRPRSNRYAHDSRRPEILQGSHPEETHSAAAPPPYVEHKAAKRIKNDINVHKNTISLSLDEQSLDTYLVSFTFDALVDGSITVFYFAKEGANCTFSPLDPDIYKVQRIPFQKGIGQKFRQPSGSGIDLRFFVEDELSKPSENEEFFPLVIYAESSNPSLIDEHSDHFVTKLPSLSQITKAVIVKDNVGNFQVKVIEQILWIGGVRYELRDIYGISNANEGSKDSDSGKKCIICLTEPSDTVVFPCRHMCLCGECAQELRFRANNCPICRETIEQFIEIK
ncbi:hypothetical protein SAY86_000949 [Trapa natans]|uniref:RING-type E3 ubiquitin transferase n=1 Tax=Trapa natans TaxID=22666 RepID=A0AAN7N024_TRANT|nr:hypothetical protein SAY86_000949 [Trapa natans]